MEAASIRGSEARTNPLKGELIYAALADDAFRFDGSAPHAAADRERPLLGRDDAVREGGPGSLDAILAEPDAAWPDGTS